MAITFDDPALRETIAPPTVAEAEEALTFWRTRAATLPVYRRAARREARAMARRWEERLREARRRESLAQQLLEAFGLDRWWRGARRVAVWTAGAAIALIVLMMVCAALIAVLLAQIAGAVL